MTKNLKRLHNILIVIFLFAFLFPVSVSAEEEPANTEEPLKPPITTSITTPEQLKKKFEKEWFRRRDSAESLEKSIEDFIEVMLNSGIANLTEFSSALVVEAKAALEKGDKKEAELLCEQAIKLSPEKSKFHFELSRVYFRSFSIVKGISTYLRAMEVRSKNFMDSIIFKANTLLYLATMTIIFIVIFTVTVVLKYLKLFLHDVSHIFPQSLKGAIVKLYTIVLFFLPLLLNLGIFWQLIYLIVLGFIYGTKREKYTFYIIAVLLAVLPLFITSALEIYSFINTDEVKDIYQANEGTWYLETEKNLEKRLDKHPGDRDLLLSMGLVNKRRGDYKRAESYYLKGLKVAPNSYELRVNLGNVYLALDKLEKAEKLYRDATVIDLKNGTAHYNLSTLYLKKVLLDDAAIEFQEAMRLSPDIILYYTEVVNTSSPNFNRMIIDEKVSKKSYIDRYNKYVSDNKGIATKILPYQIKAISFEDIPIVAVLLLVILIILQVLNKNYAFTTVCQKCGGAVCYRCQRSIKDNKLCSQCYYIIVKREGVDPKSRIIKMLQIKNYVANRMLISRIFAFVIPGTGHIFKGLTIRGIIFLSLAVILGVNILLPEGIISQLFITGVDKHMFSFGSYILLFIFAATYVVSLIDLFRSE